MTHPQMYGDEDPYLNELRAVCLTFPETHEVPPYSGPSGWLALDFEAAEVDWQEVSELLEGPYRQVTLKRMLAALDER